MPACKKLHVCYMMAQLSRQKFGIFISDMLTGFMEKCDATSPGFILCSCSDCIQKYYRIVYLNRTFVVYHLMPSFKVGGVDILSNCFSCFLEISLLREICFLIFETSESVLNYDVICPAAFTIHTLMNPVFLEIRLEILIKGAILPPLIIIY